MDGCLRRLLKSRHNPRKPLLMGIVNATPDSFSDGGLHYSVEDAVAHACRLLDEGADIIDIGGESTRPGSEPVRPDVEVERTKPVIESILRLRPGTVISIDTSKATVARAALSAGARIVNDVSALSDPAMAAVCAEGHADLILMHMRGTPKTMQANTTYADLIVDICSFLDLRVGKAMAEAIPRERLAVDPGLGFGKALDDNPRLIAHLERFRMLGLPVLIGASRKRFIGRLTGRDKASERVFGSVGAALAAAAAGADILRVHDVAATREALEVFLACCLTESPT